MKYNRGSILDFAKESSYYSAQGKGGGLRKLIGLLPLLMPKLQQLPLDFVYEL